MVSVTRYMVVLCFMENSVFACTTQRISSTVSSQHTYTRAAIAMKWCGNNSFADYPCASVVLFKFSIVWCVLCVCLCVAIWSTHSHTHRQPLALSCSCLLFALVGIDGAVRTSYCSRIFCCCVFVLRSWCIFRPFCWHRYWCCVCYLLAAKLLTVAVFYWHLSLFSSTSLSCS